MRPFGKLAFLSGSKIRGLAPAATFFFLQACAGGSVRHRANLQAMVAASDFAAAADLINRGGRLEYGEGDPVLYHLDLGMVLHDAKRYKESDAHFEAAQNKMQELYTKSVSRHAGRYIASDTTTQYAGAPFERTLVHVFRALNYAYSDNLEDALVEVRSFTQHLTELSAASRNSTYRDDAFAQFLGAILYDDAGKEDDARISLAAAEQAYQRNSAAYKLAPPRLEPPPRPTTSHGEVVFIHYNGLAPLKVPKAVPADQAFKDRMSDLDDLGRGARRQLDQLFEKGNAFVVLPGYEDAPRLISGSEIESGGRAAPTQLMADISAVARRQLETELSSAIKRMFIRYQFFQGAVRADEMRCWVALPAQIRMARLALPAGTHRVTAVFKDGDGRTALRQVFENVQVRPGRRTYLHHRTAK